MRRLSIVIPVRNDAAAVGRTLDHLVRLREIAGAEVLIAASGDPAGTEHAVAGRARLLWPPDSTRAALMNAGAAVAQGDILFFLHADSLPPATTTETRGSSFGPPCFGRWAGTSVFAFWRTSNFPSA